MSKQAVAYTSTNRKSARTALALAVATYIVGTASLTWINVGVLCRGDVKWADGCGFIGGYVAMSLVVLAPVFVAGLLAARAAPALEWRARLYMIATAATLLVASCLTIINHPVGYFFGIVVGVAAVVNAVRAVGSWLISREAARPA